MTSRPIVIQINSKQALEQLIGDDPEIALSLKNSAVQAFAEFHLKPTEAEVARHVKPLKEALHKAILAETQEIFKETGNYSEPAQPLNSWDSRGGRVGSFTPGPEMKEKIKAQVIHALSVTVAEEAKLYVDEIDVDRKIAKAIDVEVNARIEAGVRKRLDDIRSQM